MNLDRRWQVFILSYVAMLAFAVVFQSMPPVFGLLIPSLGLSHTQAGALMSLFALPGIIISIPGGMLADTYGPKRVGSGALLLMAAGTVIVGIGSGFAVVAAGRIIAGIGAMTIAIVAAQTLSRWFMQRELGTAMGIFNTAMPVGTIFVFNTFGRAAAYWNWRVPVIFTAVFTVLVVIVYALKHPGLPHAEKAEKQALLPALTGMNNAIWLTALIWAAFNAAAISFITFAADYYMTTGVDVTYAGFLTSLFMVGSLLFSPVVGYLTDKAGGQEIFIAGSSLAMAILLFLVPRAGVNPLLPVLLIGVTAAFVPAPVFSLLPKLLSPGQFGLGYGVLSTCLNIGVLLGPFLVGYSFDKTGNYGHSFSLMALFSFVAAFCALLLKLKTGQTMPEQ